MHRGAGHLGAQLGDTRGRVVQTEINHNVTVADNGGEIVALINLAEALHVELKPHNVGVSVINPGFVATPLTAQNEFHMPALISPAQAAQAIVQGWSRGEFEIHFPKRFTRVLRLLRLLPYRLYFAAVRRATGL